MVTQRSIAQVFLALQAALTAFLAVFLFVEHDAHAVAAGAGALAYVACWAAFRKGWEPARQIVVITLTVILILGLREPYLTERPIMAIMVPPIVALILTSSRWIVGSAALALLGLAIRSHFKTPLLAPLELSVFVMLVSGLVLARRSVDAAISRLASQAKSAELAREQAEAAAREAIAQRDRATKLEAALLHMQRLESIGRIAGGVAHDFNNLLTVIGASASMAERALAAGGSAKTDLQEVHLAVTRASELTKQLLTFARKQVLVKRSVELNQLVSNVERMLARVIGENAALSAKLCAEPLRVMADAGQLEQVLVNLVLNARDAIAESGGSIEIVTRRAPAMTLDEQEVEGLTAADYACVEVRDTGAGMTEEVQQRLFEPFFTTKAPARGTGLGLATSFGIVRQHEGSIRVESELGKGTLMRVLLPLATKSVEVPATSGVVRVARERQRVLVVEDEPQVRAIAVRALSSAGFEVLQAGNGALGLAVVKSEQLPFDVIVTDVVMPELSGPEMARAVRQLAPGVGLVFMSGLPEAMHSAHAGEFEDAAFLQKPFSPQVLIETVRERIAQRAQLREYG